MAKRLAEILADANPIKSSKVYDKRWEEFMQFSKNVTIFRPFEEYKENGF